MTLTCGLPSFLVIGAVKAATTWINVQLQDHPDIFMPNPEPHFFSTEFDRGLDHYRSLFAPAAPGQLVGEKSADYFAHRDAPARVAALLPSARLVVQLRNPVERAYSDYKMLFRRGTIRGRPEEYLRHGSEQPRFLEGGLYGRHLHRWLEHFPADQLHVLLYEDVRENAEEAVTGVCRHIGAEPRYSERVGTRPVNDGAAQLLPLGMRQLLAPLKPLAQPLRGTAGFERIRGLFAKQVDYPPLRPDTRAWLADYYARDVEQLQSLIGRDLGHWLELRRVAA
ncbi:sulfotransferase family protein [Sphingomonas arenae]|uniref:sulfotransferase family protein n=1 Tax=Sphingomonas arenae TaxID=2812555 RepID=UPI001967C3B7|nr:sulfotransferase [Sphingomonas arenae]